MTKRPTEQSPGLNFRAVRIGEDIFVRENPGTWRRPDGGRHSDQKIAALIRAAERRGVTVEHLVAARGHRWEAVLEAWSGSVVKP